MTTEKSDFIDHPDGESRWYDLFSRGARDWLRHNEKVREAVREQLPELISDANLAQPHEGGTVRVPVKFLEHFRFRLSEPEQGTGVGQGEAKPGDVLVGPRREQGPGGGIGGNEDGGYEFVLELKVDDIVEWLWEELKLPNLKMKSGGLSDEDYVREGWNRRGVRSRLDRRRSVKEALKRRAIRPGPDFTDDDLRFRQLVVRKRPSTEAVVFFAMDVSSSMSQEDRRLAKSFFFWVVQGLRRQYARIEPVFIAHTTSAWEFSEQEFFQVSGSGGTVASTAFDKALEIVHQRYDPSRFNIYVFYSSDGDNFRNDRENVQRALATLGGLANYTGYVEIQRHSRQMVSSEFSNLFEQFSAGDVNAGSFAVSGPGSVWDAIRAFFTEQAEEQTA
jgi:sporulation protein YhbH